MRKHPWRQVVLAACLLAWAALASNITTDAQMTGHAERAKAVRLVVSYLLNSGTAWAGLAVLAGWFVGRRAEGALAGFVAAELSLTVHYLTGWACGVFDSSVWSENAVWFAFGLLCFPLGLVGAEARRDGWTGTAARLVVPLGALVEPLVLGMFHRPSFLSWSERLASATCGGILMTGGCLAVLYLLFRSLVDGRRTGHTGDDLVHTDVRPALGSGGR